jgi:probable F420-dependent oxidoreductase
MSEERRPHPAATPGLHLGYGIISVQRPEHDTRSWAELYADELELVTEAERHGFDSAWVTEHHFTDDGYLSALFPMLAAMAARTERLHLGTDVILAPLHHPLRLAEDAAAVDCISGGRLVMGLGIGYRDAEFDALGVPKSERTERIVEHVEVCRKAFTGEPFSHRGPVVDVDGLVVRPAPPGPPPIWLGAWVDAGIRRAGRYGDGYLAPSGQVDDCRHRAEVFDESVEESGRGQGGKLPFVTMSTVAVGGITDAIAAGMAHTLSRYGDWYSSSSDEGGGRVVGQRIQAISDPAAGIVAGEPQEVIDGLAPLVELLARDRAHHLVVRLAYPGMARSEAADHIARFAEEVAPALRAVV